MKEFKDQSTELLYSQWIKQSGLDSMTGTQADFAKFLFNNIDELKVIGNINVIFYSIEHFAKNRGIGKRQISKFLYFPKTINKRTKWLVRASWEEWFLDSFSHSFEWKPIKWIENNVKEKD